MLRSAVLHELALYVCLARWIARRPAVPDGATSIGYARLVTPMLWLWVFGSATEVVVFEVVLRHVDARWADVVRLPLLVVGVWGLLWMMGLLASYRVRPHLLHDDRLVVRNGPRTWVEVPRDVVSGVRVVDHDLPDTLRSLRHADGLVLVGVSGRTNLELVLDGPTDLRTSQGVMTTDRVGLWVDDPRTAGRALDGTT